MKHRLEKTQFDDDLLSLIAEMLEHSGSHNRDSRYINILPNYGGDVTLGDCAECLNKLDVRTRTGKEWNAKSLTKYVERIPERTKKIVCETVEWKAIETFNDPFAVKSDGNQKEADKDVERFWRQMMGKAEWHSAHKMFDAMYADSEYEALMAELYAT